MRRNGKMTAKTLNNVKQKDGNRGTGRQQFVMCNNNNNNNNNSVVVVTSLSTAST